MPDFNFNNSSIKGEIVDTYNKGLKFESPISRFGPERQLIVLEWNPIKAPGEFDNPIRFPFFINPQSISFSSQHVYSQQQTRGGWVHTHWDDKPLMIKLHGNTGLYQNDFINVLRHFQKLSGKTYLELEIYKNNKNTYRDKFLSEHLSREDAIELVKILEASTLPGGLGTSYRGRSYGQSLVEGLISNGQLYEQAKTLGKIAFNNVKRVTTIEINTAAVIDLNNNLHILKQKAIEEEQAQQINNNGQVILKGSATNNQGTTGRVLTNFEIKDVFLRMRALPPNQILNSGLFSVPANQTLQPPYPRFTGQLRIFDNNILISPSGIQNRRDEVLSNSLIHRNFSSVERRFLQLSAGTLAEFASNNLRLDSAVQLANTNFRGVNGFLDFLLGYGADLKSRGNSIILGFSTTEEQITGKINELNEIIDDLNTKIGDIKEDIVALNRKIKIQTKRYDTKLAEKLLKKLNSKINTLLSNVNEIIVKKNEIDQLLITLSEVTSEEIRQNQLKISSHLEATAEQKSFTQFLFDKFNNTEQTILDANSIVVGTFVNSKIQPILQDENHIHHENAKTFINAWREKTNTLPEGANNYDIQPSDIGNLGSYTKDRFAEGFEEFSRTAGESINKIQKFADNPVGFVNTLISSNFVSSEGTPASNPRLQNAINASKEAIKNSYKLEDTPLIVTYNDIVKIKMYYAGTIYEGFITNFDWNEQAGTPNIEYDMEFLVEREFLSASLSKTPSSLARNPNTKEFIAERARINPAIDAANNNPRRSAVSTTVTGQITAPQATNPIGSSRPNPFPAPGTNLLPPLNPLPGSPGNTVNTPQGNFGVTDLENADINLSRNLSEDINPF